MTAALDCYAANIADRKFNLPSLGAVAIPTLLVWGKDDQSFCKDTVELSMKFMQAPFTLVELDSVNHWVPENGADLSSRVARSSEKARERPIRPFADRISRTAGACIGAP